ncbi:MAG: IS110 family transposase [Planctomycetes bacterium]|nr:IS110 family transposase [Planctomycetota bacterium]
MNKQSQQTNTPQELSDAVVVGIDWADQEHVVCIIDQNGRSQIETLKQSPEAIDAWVAELSRRFPGTTIAIALEQSKGALIHALMKYEHLVLYPINPKQLSRYRDAIHPSGSKNDPGDAKLLAWFLKRHAEQLRPWNPDTEATRKLARYTEIRRKIVGERQRLAQQLGSLLKGYFPLMKELFSRKLPLMTAVIKRWPSLTQLKRVHPKTLRTFLKENGIRNQDKQTQVIEAVRAAVPLTRDKAIIEPNAVYAQMLARQIQDLSNTIEQLEADIATAVAAHPDEKIFRALPGAGDALVPRLIAAFGSDRDRYDSAEEIQCYSGIAPVTRQSGKTRHVSRRYACPKFLKQTFHEFADHSRKWSPWSAAFYRQKREAGCKHQAAVRALAFKWIRIMFRLWKTNSIYDEALYIEQLKKRNSPLVKFIQNA